MPAKNTVRSFKLGGYYHVFNRGVEKRLIFQDEQDYQIFCYYLYVYLSPLDLVLNTHPSLAGNLRDQNLHGQVELISFCLMPNHFHMLIKLNSEGAVSALLKQVTNAYTGYFNEKYGRVGSLMQGRYKAVEVTNQVQLMHLSRYIHLNPVAANLCNKPELYKWSSMPDYHNGQFRPYVNPLLLEENELTIQQFKEFVSFLTKSNPVEEMAVNALIERVAIED